MLLWPNGTLSRDDRALLGYATTTSAGLCLTRTSDSRFP